MANFDHPNRGKKSPGSISIPAKPRPTVTESRHGKGANLPKSMKDVPKK